MAKKEVLENKQQQNAEGGENSVTNRKFEKQKVEITEKAVTNLKINLLPQEKIKYWEDNKFSDLNSSEIQKTFPNNSSLKGDENVVGVIKLVGDYPDGCHFVWFNGGKL